MNIYLFQIEDIEHHVIVANTENKAREILSAHLLNLWGEQETSRIEGKAILLFSSLVAYHQDTDEDNEKYLWTYCSESDEENKKVDKFGLSHNHPGCIPYA